ncbi:MAG: YidC/Oxa1 family membrane protein insertase [Eubacteriales bacterium]|nr:YidC/Oxa1 family membrane protein insertase [Eubacteriales bacterium]
MGKFFGIVIVRPLGLILMGLYSLIQNYGLAVIAFTIIIKLILLPFMYHQKKNMKKMSKVQGEAQIIQKRYAKNQAKAQEEIQKLYERENVNPMSGCLLSFITLPIMMALYYAVRKPMTYMMGLEDDVISKIADAIGFAYDPSSVNGQIELAKAVNDGWDAVSSFAGKGLVNIDFNFFGLDLSAVPHWNQLNALWLIPVISGVTALISSLVMQRMQKIQNPAAANNQNDQMATTMNTMLILMPLMSLWIAFSLPASMGLYWIVNNVFTILQEFVLTWFIVRFNKQNEDSETIARKEREEAHQKKIEDQREKQREMQRAVAAGEVEREGTMSKNASKKKKKGQKKK